MAFCLMKSRSHSHPVPKSEIPTPPPEAEARNIAAGKIPYVRGLTSTNIEAITDGKETDDNYGS